MVPTPSPAPQEDTVDVSYRTGGRVERNTVSVWYSSRCTSVGTVRHRGDGYRALGRPLNEVEDEQILSLPDVSPDSSVDGPPSAGRRVRLSPVPRWSRRERKTPLSLYVQLDVARPESHTSDVPGRPHGRCFPGTLGLCFAGTLTMRRLLFRLGVRVTCGGKSLCRAPGRLLSAGKQSPLLDSTTGSLGYQV